MFLDALSNRSYGLTRKHIDEDVDTQWVKKVEKTATGRPSKESPSDTPGIQVEIVAERGVEELEG